MDSSDTPSPIAEPLPYAEVTDPTYAEVAAQNFTVEEVAPDTHVLRGTCPRCNAVLEVPLVGNVFHGMRSIRDVLRKRHTKPSAGDRVEPVICTCEDAHPNRPEGRSGCGAYWTLLLTTEAK
ncbi:hypothetical protein ATK30_4887 [Amycolatopsis echigonensis]|uniref:Uncharacterized protein n=1 Tax=Amycolatopsis echigonensis TaxID=2576905 RepID=A0A2N3WJH5_9PSEU|nr:hypothetical protein ATK30_4887 [Amycolatopsis niigatensis]